MTPEALFQIANPVALLGWIALLLAPLSPRWTNLLAGFVLPAALSLGYAAIVLAHWSSGTGGFDTLPNVQALFTSPWIALAGWVHYLAFDLFVGAWEVRTARESRIPHLLVVPCLVLTFLFGPAGLLAFLALRAAMAVRAAPLSA